MTNRSFAGVGQWFKKLASPAFRNNPSDEGPTAPRHVDAKASADARRAPAKPSDRKVAKFIVGGGGGVLFVLLLLSHAREVVRVAVEKFEHCKTAWEVAHVIIMEWDQITFLGVLAILCLAFHSVREAFQLLMRWMGRF